MTKDYLTLIEQRLGLKFEVVTHVSWSEGYAHLAVRKDWAPLAGILQKALDSISVEEREEIFRRWLPIRYEHGFDYTLLWQALAGFAMILIGFGLWSRRLMREIRQRKAAQSELKASELFSRAILDAVSAEIAVLDSEGVIVAVNASWQRFALENGLTPGVPAPRTGLGSNYLTVCAQGDGAGEDHIALNARQGIQAVLSGQQPSFTLEYPCHSPDAQRWFSLSAMPLGAAGEGVVLSHTSITERKNAEEAQRASAQEFREMAEAMPQIVWVTRTDGWTTFFNQHWVEYTGLTLEESYGHGWSQPFHPEDQPLAQAAWQNAVATGQSYYVESRLRRADGIDRWWLMRGVPSFGADGSILKWYGTCTDIHEIKLADESLQQSLREKTALLNEVHHRVKNNLQIITSLLRLESFRSSDSVTQSVLLGMQGRVRSIALLHETIYRKGTYAAIDLGSYIGQIAGECLQSMQVSRGAIGLQLDMDTLLVGIDQATPAGMLVSELVSNCLKHAFPDGRSGAICISLHPLEEPAHWRLRITDTGVGLPADFETRRKSSLGLQLVGDMAEQMWGSLHVDAGPQAIFTIDFETELPEPVKE